MRIFFTLIILLSYLYLSAVNKYSILDGFGNEGNFTNTSFWSNSLNGPSCSCVPDSRDQMKISQNIILNTDFTIGSNTGSIEIYAGKSLHTTTYSLTVPSNTSLYVYGTLEVYNLTFANGSYVYVGPAGKIIVHNNFTNNNNSDDVLIDGNVDVSGTYFNGNGGIIAGNGSLTATTFTGTGTTFGYTNNAIPPGATVSTGSLPVEFISFEAKSENNEVMIMWQTLTEINSKNFEIERSENGYIFKTVGVIAGAGTTNSANVYTFIDKPDHSGVFYYRLKQNDNDGKFGYTEIINVEYIMKGEYNVYPNPVEAGSEIFIAGFDEEIFMVEIYDSSLKLISEHVSDGKITLDRNLKPGNYIIIVRDENNTHTSKIVIY